MGKSEQGVEDMGGEAKMQPPNGQEEKILVSVRVRPLNEKEVLRNEVVDWECISNTTIIYKNHSSPERAMYPSSYTFDRVFKSDCSTRHVYEEGAKSVVLSVVSGINSSVFAYGQTSSGKTFTMSGITEYTMEDIFDCIHKHKEREFQLKFSAMEIYNESVRDLLTADNSPLRLLDDPERGTVVEKLTEETLRDWNHFTELLAACEAQRQIGETFLNEASSRSHQILRLTIESSTREFLGKNNSSTLTATLNFVDLAGSERASQALSAGSRLKEGSHINRSLLTLGTVIRKLSKGRTGHIPYRDSKLTRILQSSLGGNARTAIICTMSPAQSYVEQSRNTLLFASRAKEVTTNARVNVVMSDKALVKHLQRELGRLESELKSASPSVRADVTDLLREKDFKIQELERRVKELTLQLDVAQSQIQDLQGAGHRSPIIWEGEDSSYPRLHVPQALEGYPSDTFTATDEHSSKASTPTFGTPQSPDRHSRLSYDENYSISDFEDNLPSNSPFEHMSTGTPSDASPPRLIQTPKTVGNDCYQVPKAFGQQTSLSDIDPYIISEEIGEPTTPKSFEVDGQPMSEEIKRQTPDTFDIHRQQVSDRDGEQSPYFVDFDPYQVYDGIEEQNPDSLEIESCQVPEGVAAQTANRENIHQHQSPEVTREQADEHLDDCCEEVQRVESETTDNVKVIPLPPEGERESLLLIGHENGRFTDDEVEQESKLGNMSQSSPREAEEPSDRQEINDAPESKNLNCIESSCQSNDTSNVSSSFLEKEKSEIKNESGHRDDEVVVRKEDTQKQPPALRNDTAKENSETSVGDSGLDKIPAPDIKSSNDKDKTGNRTSVTETTGKAKSQSMKQLLDGQVEDTMQENKSTQNMKDVGLNPQHDLVTTPSPLDLQRLQTEIINLWDACNVSLVHRTYFFLLFIKADPADTIYMEVERRRLSFLKDAFSSGNFMVLDGRKVTSASSKRSLHNEREMLGRQMKRRFSRQERKDLYVKWGIRLDAKRRSSQLAHRLWITTADMDHIVESANIIAKLVRFSEPQVPKEVFGLNLLSMGKSKWKSYRWKHKPNLFM